MVFQCTYYKMEVIWNSLRHLDEIQLFSELSLLCITIIFNSDDITNENKEHNKKWPYIPDHRYRILIIGGSGSGKTNAVLNLIKQQDDTDKIYLYAKDAGIKHLNDSNAFIECWNTMDDVYKNIDDYNPTRRRKILMCLMTWLQILWVTKNFRLSWKNFLLGAGNEIFRLYLSHSLIFLLQKMSV